MITERVIESYLYCRYKAFQILNSKNFPQSPFELFVIEQSKRLKKRYCVSTKANKIKSFDKSRLDNSKAYILDEGRFKSAEASLELEAFETPSDSESSECIIPIFFNYSAALSQKARLAYCIKCLFLEKLIGCKIRFFKVYLEGEKSIRVRVEPIVDLARITVDDLIKLSLQEKVPSFFKISECAKCANQNSCMSQLIKKDCISLLGKTNSKSVQTYNNKGLFSINQLSYSFRPRKGVKRYYPELHALSIRLQKIHIWSLPELPKTETQFLLILSIYPLKSSFT